MNNSSSGPGVAERGFSVQRRFQIGANVAIAVGGAALLVVLLNWMAAARPIRRDVSSYGGYGLSDRTKSIIADYKGDVTISVLYSLDESGKDNERYLDRVLDSLDELRQVAPNAKVENIRSIGARAKLVARLAGTFGGEADKHKAVVASFKSTVGEIQRAVAHQMELSGQLQASAAWLNDFPVYADIIAALRADQERLRKAGEYIDQITGSGGVPKYAEAIDRIKGDLTTFKTNVAAEAKRIGDLAKLAEGVSEGGGKNLEPFRKVAETLPPLIAELKKPLGDKGDPMPSNIPSALKAFADRGLKADDEIQRAVREAEAVSRRFPMIADHVNWSVQSSVGSGLVMQLPLTRLLSESGKQLADLRLQILGLIDKGDKATLETAVKRLRRFVGELNESCTEAAKSLRELADHVAKIDPGSKAILDEARADGFLKTSLQAVDKLLKDANALPELKLGTIADDIKEDNVIVVEANKKVRVIKFDEVWPIRQMIDEPTPGQEPVRAFNGDAALSAALLGLTKDKPFATIVLVSYEQKESPAQRFMRPPPPVLPLEQLTTLRKRLTDSNFKVVEWDLTKPDAPPKPTAGTENIFLVLPPAMPAPPNPFGGAPPGKPFGPPEQKRLVDAIGKDGRAVFVTSWDIAPASAFGGMSTQKYALGDYLREQWGITIEGDYRITWIVPDPKHPEQIGVNPERFQYMPVNSFTNQPIGKPFQARSVRLADACPMRTVEPLPAGVTIEKILDIPPSEEYIGAGLTDLISIINEINNPASSGFVKRSASALRPPFTVMLAASRDKGPKIIVCTAAHSFSDMVLSRPMLRATPDGRLVSEPPPMSNAELLINSLYWLHGQDMWIAAGPPAIPTIRAIGAEQMTFLRILTYAIWPALVFAPGLFIWFARRR